MTLNQGLRNYQESISREIGGFSGNMIDNTYTFTNAGSIGSSIVISVIAGALCGIGTVVSNRIATAYYNRQLSNASSKTAHQISFFEEFRKNAFSNYKRIRYPV